MPWGLLGAASVALGVAGELYAEPKIETVETRIRIANEQLFLLLSKEAGDAKQSALDAKAAADDAGLVAAKVKRKTDALARQATALEAQLASTKAQLEAVDAQRAELEESLRNLAICTAPRVLPKLIIGGGKQR